LPAARTGAHMCNREEAPSNERFCEARAAKENMIRRGLGRWATR
jgi:hypothetical protein